MFAFRRLESRPRSIPKAVSWRTVGSIDTVVPNMLFTSSNARIAGSIAGTEVVTGILLFCFHERAWSLVRRGHRLAPGAGAGAA